MSNHNRHGQGKRRFNEIPLQRYMEKSEFKNITRKVQRYVGEYDSVILRGSGVTGRSYKTGRPFSRRSDLDLGIVSPNLWDNPREVEKGWPKRGSPLDRLQNGFNEDVKHFGFNSKRSGIKVFRSFPEGDYYRRSITPESERGRDSRSPSPGEDSNRPPPLPRPSREDSYRPHSYRNDKRAPLLSFREYGDRGRSRTTLRRNLDGPNNNKRKDWDDSDKSSTHERKRRRY